MDLRFKEVSIAELFEQFIEASTMKNVLSIHQKILEYADVSPCRFDIFYPKYKRAVMGDRIRKNWKAKALFSKIDKKSSHRCYSNTKTVTSLGNGNCDSNGADFDQEIDLNSSLSLRTQYGNNALQNHNCLIIGAGPAGLRTAIELQFLGASKVVVVEKRGRFSRNNVLHLWPFVIDDLKSLGAKKFYGKFCAGSIDHISIRQLQLMLLKVTLMIGCDFRHSCSYISLCQATIKQTSQITEGNNCDNYKACCTDNWTQQTKNNESDLQVDNSTKQSVNVTVKVPENAIQAKDQPTIKIDHHETSIRNNNDSDDKNSDKENCLSDKVADSFKSQSNLISQYAKRCENLKGARAHFESECEAEQKDLESHEWDIIIGADGRRNTLSKFFPRKEFRGRLAIAITANFINRQTPAETAVPEISGLSFIYNQDMFNSLAYDTNIALENICYYKDDTHYFVMTAKKKSLLERGVLTNDYAATQDLLSDNNVDRDALLRYAKDAAYWTTGLEPLDFALNHYGQEDCAMFDFTSMYAASNACKAIRTARGGFTLVGLVGDSLLEPFWPTGSGCARGFLSSFDAAWMCRQWAVNRCAIIDYHSSGSSRSSARKDRSLNVDSMGTVGIPEKTTYNKMALSVMAERESIYRILTQTTSENLQQNYSHWTLNPHSRYPNLNRHLVLPYQVEHLITDSELKVKAQDTARQQSSKSDVRLRRVKSPREKTARRSPKKLKSATASPLMPQRNLKNRSRSLSKPLFDRMEKRDRHDFGLDPTFMEFEQSYRNLSEADRGNHLYYLNHLGSSQSIYDDLLTPSISGTHPSSNNLMSLEAKRARDIDECLRQRRQKSKMHVVRDQLIDQFRGQSVGRDATSSAGNVALFNELRRLREQRSKDRSESRPRDITGPLSLLNSMRRCASFAERVKSFEGKLSPSETSTPAPPKTAPIDNVRNLPQFVLLQELFVNGSNKDSSESEVKKTRIPITKLTKDDWNVKCWEKRLALHKQKSEAENFRGSSKSLNKSLSVDNHKPQKQIEVFKDRIKEMANKLDVVESTKDKVTSTKKLFSSSFKAEKKSYSDLVAPERPQSGWVKHLKNELIKEAEANKYGTRTTAIAKGMNPATPSKPIKKLFEDDDEDDHHNQHFDHLCVNKNIWRKGSYTSHLARNKYDTSNWRITNKPNIQVPGSQRNPQQASRSTSPSSTLSNYSTATAQSSTDSGGKVTRILSITECARCKDLVNLSDKITVVNTVLHRKCLTCASCGITLRSNEIEHHLESMRNDPNADRDGRNSFVCAICEPSIRKSLNRDLIGKSANEMVDNTQTNFKGNDGESYLRGMRSRQKFLDTRIDYDELYKNIIDNGTTKQSSEGVTISSQSHDDKTNGRLSSSACCRIETETGDDGIEKATLTLPSSSNDPAQVGTQERSTISGRDLNPKLIDEEDLQRILHLGKSANVADSQGDDANDEDSDTTSGSSIEDDAYANGSRVQTDKGDKIPSEASSSLNSPPETDEYDDEDDDDDDYGAEGDRNDEHSTYGFITSEEFGTASDKEQDRTDSLNGSDDDDDENQASNHTPRSVEACEASV